MEKVKITLTSYNFFVNKVIKILLLFTFLFFTFYTINAQTTWDIGYPNATDVTATLSNDTLYVQGVGNMMNFSIIDIIIYKSYWYSDIVSTIIIEQGVTSIGEYAFFSCGYLTSLPIPQSVTSIGIGAFTGSGFTSIIIPNGITNIKDGTFQACSNLVSVIIPEGVTSIGQAAFAACSSLTSVVIPSTIMSIEPNAFCSCPLSSVTLLNPVPISISITTFPCDTLYVPCGSKTDYKQAFVWRNFNPILELSPCPPAGVSNVQVDFSCPDGVTITYDLSTDCKTDVLLYYSADDLTWLPAQNVSDNMGQSSGTGKTMVWNNVADNVRYGGFYLKIETTECEKKEEECVMINGVCWAKYNVDAPGTFTAKPEDAGMFYQWNRKKGWTSTGTVTGWDGTDAAGNSWGKANDPCPDGWRVPTKEEFESLVSSSSRWDNLNGVNGYFFGSGAEQLFLPAAGYRNYSSGTLYDVGSNGIYWSSTANGSEYAYYLYFDSGSAGMIYNSRSFGFSVRCVTE